jgi:hypothetical protein
MPQLSPAFLRDVMEVVDAAEDGLAALQSQLDSTAG